MGENHLEKSIILYFIYELLLAATVTEVEVY